MIATRLDVYRVLFFLSSFIFVSFAVGVAFFGEVSVYEQIMAVVAALLFIVLSLIYLLGADKKIARFRGVAIKLLFAALLGDLIFIVAILGTGLTTAASLANALQYIGFFMVIYLPVIFLVFFGIYLYRKRYRKLALLLFGIAIVILLLYFATGLLFHHYTIDDELFIAYYSVQNLLNGVNPYSISVAQQLYLSSINGTINSPTITTANKIVGTLNYPSLYILSLVPFYLLASPSLLNFENWDLEIQSAVFVLLAIFTTALVVKKKYIEKPVYSLIIFLAVVFAYLSSVTVYLMFALLLLAYTKLEGKWSWLFLGLCLSVQEQLWFPVVLLIIYSLNNNGLKKGFENVFGALGVFLVFNLYFILNNPSAFFGNIFGPINQLLFPESSSSIGYLIATNYHILLSTYTTLFDLSLLALALLFVYFNRKKLVGLFAMTPFLLLSHSIPIYYTFFTGFMVVTIFINEPEGKGIFTRYMQKHKTLFCSALLLVVLTGIVATYTSHISYTKGFSISAVNGTLYFNNTRNITEYSAVIHYSNLSNDTIYIASGVVEKLGAGFAGFYNYTLILNRTNCTGYPCAINSNMINLPKNKTTYNLHIYLHQNGGEWPYGVRIIIYNGEYYYSSWPAFNMSLVNKKV